MKTNLLLLLILLMGSKLLEAQQITPAIKANFGVDGDLRANYYGFPQPGTDDWFMFPGSVGAGKSIIDTTGAAALVARYAIDPAYRQTSFLSHHECSGLLRWSIISWPLTPYSSGIIMGDDSTTFASGF